MFRCSCRGHTLAHGSCVEVGTDADVDGRRMLRQDGEEEQSARLARQRLGKGSHDVRVDLQKSTEM